MSGGFLTILKSFSLNWKSYFVSVFFVRKIWQNCKQRRILCNYSLLLSVPPVCSLHWISLKVFVLKKASFCKVKGDLTSCVFCTGGLCDPVWRHRSCLRVQNEGGFPQSRAPSPLCASAEEPAVTRPTARQHWARLQSSRGTLPAHNWCPLKVN